MKKVLFITTRLVYPVNDGRKVVIYNYCKGLSENYNCEVRLFSIIDEYENVNQPEFINKVYSVNPPQNIEKIRNLLLKSILLRKWPFQVSLYYSKEAKKKLYNVINEYKPDIIITDMARTAEYLRDLDKEDINKILDMDDILSKRYRRQVEAGTMGIDAVGAYSKKLPRLLRGIIGNKKIAEFILKKEANLLYKYEIEISKHYKSIIFVSPIEAEEFNNVLGENKCIDITIGVDYDYFSKVSIKEKEENCIAFLGNMYVAHNKDAVSNFIKNIFPLILKEIPECKFRVVGRCSEEYKRNIMLNKNVEVTGEVEDIREWIQKSTVLVAPLTYGSGIKTKILETMAMGVPVVTNNIGTEGMNIKNDINIIVRENNDDFANEIKRLLKDDNYREKISQEGSKYVRENHQWSEILKRFQDIL